VTLDGVARGAAPLTVSRVRAGTHTVRVELEGYERWTTAVTVASGSHVRITPRLRPLRGRGEETTNDPE
jgi:hypothetical protein